MKYRGGSVPPLVAMDNDKNAGLLSEELLEIFQKGFSAMYTIPLCISFVSENHLIRTYSSNQEEDLSDQKLMNLLMSCKYFQPLRKNDTKDVESGSESCGCYFADHGFIMKDIKARAYMCYAGMIGFSVSVRVAGEIVAILSTECKKPKEGVIWSDSFLEQNNHRVPAIDYRIPSSAARVDLWQESKRRIQKCEAVLGLEPGGLLRELNEKVKADPKVEVSPEELEVIMLGLENAGKHLSDLADKTYRLEKESVVGWLRAEMASALSASDIFWDRIRWCFGNLAQLVGVDYILLVLQDGSPEGSLHLQCQYGLPQNSLPALKYDWTGSAARVDYFIKKVGTLEHIQEVDLRQYRDMPILGMLYSLYGKGVNYPVLIVSTITLDGRLTCMVLGKKDIITKQQMIVQSGAEEVNIDSCALTAKWLREDDRRYLITIVRELAIITNVFFSMKKLQETEKAQTDLMESVAHDLRTPIQNIMIAAENLRECRVAPERASRTITGVVTQLQRLNLLAQKAWTLEQIRLDKLIYDDKQLVNPYLIFTECRAILTDMAERGSIEIHINPNVKHWRAMYLDVEMFRLVVLNLLHNGIKYSFPNTCVRIGGWQDGVGIGVAMTFENEGIPVHDEEKDRIFERYFRSNDAVKTDPAGSGVGLALVKEFVDHYKGRIVVRSTEVNFGRYLNVFSLFLPGR